MSRKVVTHRGKTRYKYTPVVPQSRSRLSRLRLGTPRRLPFRESPRLSRGRARGRVSVSRSFIYIYTQREKTSAHRGGFHACFSVQIRSTFDTFYGRNLHTLERRLIVSDTHTHNTQKMNPVERSGESGIFFDTQEPQFLNLKCVVVGDGAVGKTSMLLCYTTNTFPTDHMPTIFDNYSKNVTMRDGRVVNLGLWDTAGQDEYADFRPLSYSAADCFIVAFSLCDRESFRNVEQKWLNELRSKAPKTPIVLVGTKLDLRGGGGGGNSYNSKRGGGSMGDRLSNDMRAGGGGSNGEEESEPISEAEGQALARRIKAVSYVECSSLVQTNLSLVFEEVIEAHVNPAVVKIEEQKSCCAIQ